MDVVSLVENVIKDHPLIDFNYKNGTQEVHWCCCPCGFATKRYKSAKAAQKAFNVHVVDEANEALVEQGLLLETPLPVFANS